MNYSNTSHTSPVVNKIYMSDIWKSSCGIYKITNIITGDFYIGSSINIYKRLSLHKSYMKLNKHDNHKIRNHAILHGIESFRFEIIEYCDLGDMHLREQYYVDLLNPTYNSWKNVLSPKGFRHSKESIEKMRSNRSPIRDLESFRNKLKDAWTRRRLTSGGMSTLKMLDRTGKKHSPETVEIFKSKRKGVSKSEEFKEKMRNIRLGSTWDSENRTWIRRRNNVCI